MDKYDFNGAFIYGNRDMWPAFGVGNYILAKMFWDPGQDAHQLLKEYLNLAYGSEAAPHIENLYALLDTSFRKFYNQHLRAGSTLTEDHLKEIYAPNYKQFEEYYLRATHEEKSTKQQERLSLLGERLAIMKITLKNHKVL